MMNTNKSTIRIVIADDHSVVRKGLTMVLNQEDDIEVIGEAGNGKQALEVIKTISPDIALLDLVMPEMDGRETAMAIRKTHPEVKIIILTGTAVNAIVVDLIERGVDGYVPKEIDPNELKQVIRAVYKDEIVIHPTVVKDLLAFKSQYEDEDDPESKVRLTPRELEVLHWMGTAHTYKEIADELFVTEETIRSHAKNILAKFDQPNRAQAVLAAVRAGIMALPDEGLE